MEFLHRLIFAGDAELLAMIGAGLVLLGLLANYMERRRVRRARIDQVGWVPWLSLFMASTLIGGGLLMIAVPSILRG
ncbi:hypothetical protein LY632_11820 [Erythrobacter sp. SDW2]|uniref:hypothetical protein n=1 Tax=Erythrobacter sp. SDW2 TaxID=2907154 RepID=UPI001F362BD8|nr:hypothetical protein [Erythrobacter sp. SDW2]UIP06371.1 hypothetical protein LY632_11820 [Erythrobacter sp. SDW2]